MNTENADEQLARSNRIFEWIQTNWFIVCIVLIVISKNWLLEIIPFVPRNGYPHDDSLMLGLAIAIVEGNWFGDFDQYILIKGPVYPLWIAFNYFLGLDIIHTQDFLFLFASLVVVRAISIDVKNKGALLLVFAIIYLNPVSFDFASISHGFRMVIYTSLTLLCFGAILGLVLRLNKTNKRYIYWSILFGIAFALFWYTREEGRWVLPGFAFIAFASIIAFSIKKKWIQARSTVYGIIVIPVLIWGLFTGIFSYINYKHYGVFYVVEVMTPNFTRAYNALLRIEPEEYKAFYPVRAATMEKLLKLSPKASELTAFKGQKDFRAFGFIWAFRQAVDYAGYYDKGAKEVDQYYSDLADEIEALCENKTLNCNKQLLSYVRPWRTEYTEKFGSVFVRLMKRVIKFKDFSMDQSHWYAADDSQYRYNSQRLTHSRIQFHAKQRFRPDTKFWIPLTEFKRNVLDQLGQLQLSVRPAIFYFAVIVLLIIGMRDLLLRRFNPYTIYSLAVLGSMLVLVAGLSIIEITAYNSLFRALHGVHPLPPLFIVAAGLAVRFDRLDNKANRL